MSDRVLEANLGLMHVFCAHTAIENCGDPRAQEWLARRLPAEMDRQDRVIHFPSPFDVDLIFINKFEENPDWRDVPVLVAARKRREAYERTAAVGYERGEQVISYRTFETPRFSGMIVDWLNALPEIDPRMMDKLSRVTWQQAIQHALAWHNRLAAKRDEGIAGDEGAVDRTDVPGMPGWCWYHLVTPRALDNEGDAMGHCVGQGGYDKQIWERGERPDVWSVDEGIWSLRDPSGRSRVTVEIDFDGIVQAQGPGNERPEEVVVSAFETLLARFVKPGFPFDVPYWLFREVDGATRLRSADEARADFEARAHFRALAPDAYAIPRGQVQFRAVGDAGALADLGDVEHLQLDLPSRVDSGWDAVAPSWPRS